MTKCSKCGKSLSAPNGTTIVGLQLVYRDNEFLDSGLSRSLWGKYLLNKTEVDYDFCYECWIDSLMGAKSIMYSVKQLIFRILGMMKSR